MPLTAGNKLGPYEIICPLGAGGMGEVWKARDPRLDRLVAVKVLPEHIAKRADLRQRFEREARVVASLNHPHICVLFDIGNHEGTDFMVMECLEGETLAERIGKGAVPLEQALAIAAQVADALDRAHRAGVTHRDVKPGNIMLTRDGVKVLDFGLATLIKPDEAGDADATVPAAALLTEVGTVLGTAAYMSPEQARGQRVDARTDIFSLGVVLYEMIAGTLPFRGVNALDVISSILQKEPAPRLTPQVAGVPRELERLLGKTLRKDREQRYQTARELLIDLKDLTEEMAFAAKLERSGQAVKQETLTAPAEIMPGQTGESRRRLINRRWYLALAGLMVLALVWMAGNREHARQEAVLYKPQSLTGYEGNEIRPGISQDGSQVAFFWAGVKESGLYVKTINIEPPRVVFAGPGNYPVWSPDGHQIAFVRFPPRRAGSAGTLTRDLCVTPSRGGPEQMVAAGVNWRGLSWSPDGKWLAFGRHTRDNAIALFRVEVATGTVQQLTHPDPGVEDEFPAYSSDGRHVAFSRRAGNDKMLFRVPVEGGGEAPVGNVKGTAELAWIPGTADLLINMKPGGSSDRGDLSLPPQLIRMSTLPPYRMEPMAGIGGGEIDFVIAGISMSRIPPGRLVYEIYPYDNNIWLARLNASAPSPAARIVASTRQDQGARFSPDGKRIVFRTNRSGRNELWLCMADGSGQMPLTGAETADGSLSFGQWSADGSRILFSVRNGLYEIPASGGTPRRIDQDPGHKDQPAWSADGRFAYFRSNRSGSPQIWRMPAGGGNPVQVTRDGGDHFSLSPDGKLLYFNRSELVGGIWRVPVEGGEEKLVAPGGPYPSFTVGQTGIYWVGRSDRPEFPGEIRLKDHETGKEMVVAYLKQLNLSRRHDLSLSADETQMLMTVEDTRGADLMMVEGVR